MLLPEEAAQQQQQLQLQRTVQEEARADREQQRAAQEQARADQAEKEKAQLLERLRAKGIDLDTLA